MSTRAVIRSASILASVSCLAMGGYRALYGAYPDTGHDETAGDARVLRVFGSGQSRDCL